MPRRMMLRVRRLASTVLAVALASAALVFVTDPPHVAVAATGDECPAVPIYNHHRPHTAIGKTAPITRISSNRPGHYS